MRRKQSVGATRRTKEAQRTKELMVKRAMAYPPPPLLLERLRRELEPLGPHGGQIAMSKVNRRWLGPIRMTEATTRECFEELKRFLITKVLHPELKLAPSSLVDEAWHAFIIFTEAYFEFCELVGGYIHHRPLTSNELKGVTPPHETQILVRSIFPESNGYFWETDYERERSFSYELTRPRCCG
jgi:hypothetical protein